MKDNTSGRVRDNKMSRLNTVYHEIYDYEFFHREGDYTIEDLKQLINIFFISKKAQKQSMNALTMVSYTFEKLSDRFDYIQPKKCDINLLEKAFIECGFEIFDDILDKFPNITAEDYNFLQKLLSRV